LVEKLQELPIGIVEGDELDGQSRRLTDYPPMEQGNDDDDDDDDGEEEEEEEDGMIMFMAIIIQ